jgi:hypothetical protein
MICYAKPCMYCAYIYIWFTCKTLNIRCPQGTRLSDNWLCRMLTCKIVNIHDILLNFAAVNMALVARASSICKWQTCPLIREGAPNEQTCNCLTVTKILDLGPSCGLTPKQTGQLIVGRNVTLILTLKLVESWQWSSELWDGSQTATI